MGFTGFMWDLSGFRDILRKIGYVHTHTYIYREISIYIDIICTEGMLLYRVCTYDLCIGINICRVNRYTAYVRRSPGELVSKLHQSC